MADGELSLTRLALDDGELRHAAEHVANALAAAPSLPEVHELLAAMIRHPDGGPDLWSLDGDVYVGTVAARAHALAGQGQYGEALRLLSSAQGHAPEPEWANVPWVLDPATAGRVGTDDLVTLLARLFEVCPDPCPDRLRPAMAPYLTLVRNAIAAHPDDAELLWVASIFVRRLGEVTEATELAQRSEQLVPSERAAIAVGYALRAQGRTDEALAAWERALSHNAQNLALYADIAELLGAAGRRDDAIAWTDKALRIDPTHDCSIVTGCSLRHERDEDVAELVRVADLLQQTEPGTHEAQHANGVLTERSQRYWWTGPIPPPSESVISVLNQVLDDPEAGHEGGTLTISAVEPPSALLAFDRVLPGFEVSVEQVLPPDPRVPVPDEAGPRAVAGVAWTYEGTTARPAFAPPRPEAAGAVAALAARPWPHIPAAYDDAVRLATTDLGDLLGVLVHPPEPPTGERKDWPQWIRAVQCWACLGVAHHRTDEPWEDSTRRQVLADLAYGPEDWVSEAALFALAAVAWTVPETREDVALLVGWRFIAAVEAQRPVTIFESLASLVLATPDMDPSVRSLAVRALSPESEEKPEPKRRRGLFRRG